MPTILTAIQTHYAGCRFRSRLEARWAVFFDHLALPWQYEPQGYTVGPDATPYLPDFWLPTLKLWVEVKGQLEQTELETLIWASCEAGLPLEPDGDRALRQCFPWMRRMLLLGAIPQPGDAWLHMRIDVVAHDLVIQQPAVFLAYGKDRAVDMLEVSAPRTLNEYITGTAMPAGMRRRLIDGAAMPGLTPWPRISDAYRAARSARFEHGETPS